MTERNIPYPRQPEKLQTRQVNLHEVLVSTAESNAARAKTVVGSTEPRRVAGYLRELNFVKDILAEKWGVDPRQIPIQRAREIRLIYQRPPVTPLRPSSPEQNPTLITDTIDTEMATQETPPTLTHQEQQGIPQLFPEEMTTELLVLNDLSVARGMARIRTQKKISQEVFGELMGISKSYVDKMERELRTYDANIVLDACDVLGISETDPRRNLLITKALNEERERRKTRQARKKIAVFES